MAPKFQKYKLQDGSTWYRVADKKEIFEVLDMADDNAYMIVGGNTAHGKIVFICYGQYCYY